MKRTLIGFLAGSLIPPLAATQLLSVQGKLADGESWLLVLGILISCTSAVAIKTLTDWNAAVGNPPVAEPPTLLVGPPA